MWWFNSEKQGADDDDDDDNDNDDNSFNSGIHVWYANFTYIYHRNQPFMEVNIPYHGQILWVMDGCGCQICVLWLWPFQNLQLHQLRWGLRILGPHFDEILDWIGAYVVHEGTAPQMHGALNGQVWVAFFKKTFQSWQKLSKFMLTNENCHKKMFVLNPKVIIYTQILYGFTRAVPWPRPRTLAATTMAGFECPVLIHFVCQFFKWISILRKKSPKRCHFKAQPSSQKVAACSTNGLFFVYRRFWYTWVSWCLMIVSMA